MALAASVRAAEDSIVGSCSTSQSVEQGLAKMLRAE